MPAVSTTLNRFGHMLATWGGRARARAAMRKELTDMDDAVLADFGLTRGEAETLVNRPFWVK